MDSVSLVGTDAGMLGFQIGMTPPDGAVDVLFLIGHVHGGLGKSLTW